MTMSVFNRISSYLQQRQWEVEYSALEGKLIFMSHKDKAQIIEIHDDSLPSSERYLRDAVTFIAKEEKKSIEAFQELFCTKKGVMQLRVPNTKGEIRIDASIGLRKTARQILVATSHSNVFPIINHPMQNVKSAMKKFHQCTEIPAKEGSYIATILIPNEIGITDITESALRKTEELVSKDIIPTSSLHADLAEHGVSANFLDAFESLVKVNEGDNIEISFAGGSSVFEIKITQKFCSFVKDLSSSFKSNDKEKNVEVTGTVSGIAWNEKGKIGTIRVKGNIKESQDGNEIKSGVEIILQTSETTYYEIARDADYPQKKKIYAKGTLIPGPKLSRIADISEFRLV